jgi:hypothetical protein
MRVIALIAFAFRWSNTRRSMMFKQSRKIMAISLVFALIMTSGFVTFAESSTSSANVKTKSTRTNMYKQPIEEETNVLNKLTPKTGWDLAVSMTQCGTNTDWGFRLVGTDAAKDSADLVYNKFNELGLNPEYETFDAYGWKSIGSSFEVVGEDLQFDTVPCVGTKPTVAEGITAEIVPVGSADKEYIEGLTDNALDGKIALLALSYEVHEWHSQAIEALERYGAEGVLYYFVDSYAQEEGALNAFDWSGKEVNIPVLNTSKKHGESLEDLLKNGGNAPYTGKLISDVEIDEEATGYNVIGQITGTKYPDEYIVINGHMDGYFKQFQDDALAVGAMTSIAEAMKKADYKPDRTFLFIGFDGEECGNLGVRSDWLSGSWNLLKDKNSEWSGKIVGAMTLEWVGYDESTTFDLRGGDMLYDFVSETPKSFEFNNYDGVKKTPYINGISPLADEFSFAYYGIPTFRTDRAAIVVSTYYHSQFDTPEKVTYERYAEAVGHYTKLLMRLDKQPVNPYNLTFGIDKYINSIDFDNLKSIDGKERLKKLSAEYKSAAEQLYDQSTEILTLYNKAKLAGKDLTSVDKNGLTGYNRKIRETAKDFFAGTLSMEGLYTQRYAVDYYQNMIKTLDDALTALKAGNVNDAVAALEKLPATKTAKTQDYDTWYTANYDNIYPDARETHWTKDIGLRYFDHYKLLEGLEEKKGESSPNLSAEINKCNEFMATSKKELKYAYNEDVVLFSDVNKTFPLEDGQKIIIMLNELIKDDPVPNEVIKDDTVPNEVIKDNPVLNELIKSNPVLNELIKDNTVQKAATKTISIKTAQKSIYLKKGQDVTLPLKEYTNDGEKTTLTYKSSNKKVATVNKNGKVSAKKSGKAKITVTSKNGKKLKFTIIVTKKAIKVKSIKVKYTKTMNVGKSKVLKVTIQPKKATKAIAIFSSSKKSVLTVDEAGKITAKGKGTAEVTIKAGGKEKVIKVKVK